MVPIGLRQRRAATLHAATLPEHPYKFEIEIEIEIELSSARTSGAAMNAVR
jgi:hypothetical protein